MPASIALLGSGLFAEKAYLPAILQVKADLCFHTIWSRSQKSAEALLAKAKELGITPLPAIQFGEQGLQDVLKNQEIDGVMLVLPITAQPPLILRALAAGKHVMSEKPIHKDVKHAIELVDEYERTYLPKGLILRIAENWAYEPVVHYTRDVLRDPAIGPVLYWNLQAHNTVLGGTSWHATEWRTIPDYQGGFILDGGVHQAALLRMVLPNPPSSILAHATLHRAHLPPHDTFVAIASPRLSSHTPPHGPDAQSHVSDSSTLPNKLKDIPSDLGHSAAHGTITLAWSTPDVGLTAAVAQNKMEITCLNAIVTFSWSGVEMECTVTPAKASRVEFKVKRQERSGVKEEVAQFARAVSAAKRGETSPEENNGDPRNSVWDLACIQACLQSNGVSISIDDLVRGK